MGLVNINRGLGRFSRSFSGCRRRIRRCRSRLDRYYWLGEAISLAWDCFDESRVFRGVAECFSHFVECGGEIGVEIHVGVGRPEMAAEFFASYEAALAFYQDF